MTRVIEIDSCKECPYLDVRWKECTNIGALICKCDRIPKFCPLQTVKEYVEEHRKGKA